MTDARGGLPTPPGPRAGPAPAKALRTFARRVRSSHTACRRVPCQRASLYGASNVASPFRLQEQVPLLPLGREKHSKLSFMFLCAPVPLPPWGFLEIEELL